MLHVVGDGAGLEHEPLRDLHVGQPLRDKLHDLQLTSRQGLSRWWINRQHPPPEVINRNRLMCIAGGQFLQARLWASLLERKAATVGSQQRRFQQPLGNRWPSAGMVTHS